MRSGCLGAGGETVGREIASRLGVALQRDKDVGQGTGEQFRVKEVVRFLKGPVLRRCNGYGFGGCRFSLMRRLWHFHSAFIVNV
jgi:hypothetical protein